MHKSIYTFSSSNHVVIKSVETALREYIRMKHRQELIQMIGHYDDFTLSLEKLENLRNET